MSIVEAPLTTTVLEEIRWFEEASWLDMRYFWNHLVSDGNGTLLNVATALNGIDTELLDKEPRWVIFIEISPDTPEEREKARAVNEEFSYSISSMSGMLTEREYWYKTCGGGLVVKAFNHEDLSSEIGKVIRASKHKIVGDPLEVAYLQEVMTIEVLESQKKYMEFLGHVKKASDESFGKNDPINVFDSVRMFEVFEGILKSSDESLFRLQKFGELTFALILRDSYALIKKVLDDQESAR